MRETFPLEESDEQKLQLGIDAHSKGKFKEAEKIYKAILQNHSNSKDLRNNFFQKKIHHFTWKVLGDLLKQIGKLNEALIARKKVIEYNLKDAEAYYNFANILNELGRLHEAEENYKQAIIFKPDFVSAYCNLAITLKNQGRLEEAEINYKKAIFLKPEFAEVYNNLGNILKELGRLNEAEANYRKAMSLNNNFVKAYNGLGIILLDQGKLEDAEMLYEKAIKLKPDYVEAILNLSIVHHYMNNPKESIKQLNKILKLNLEDYKLKARVNLALYKFLEDDFIASKKNLVAALKIQRISDFGFTSYKVFRSYLKKILFLYKKKSSNYNSFLAQKKIYVIGDSHSLVCHNLCIKTPKEKYQCKSLFIQGCKQWSLGDFEKNKYKVKFESLFSSLPKKSLCLISVGEIDCRLDSGVIKYKNKYPKKNLTKIIEVTVERYLNYIFNINSNNHCIIIQGIPCPNINRNKIPKEKINELINVIKNFNLLLREKSSKMRFSFLDLHKLTDRGDGFSNKKWHLDTYHLIPEAIIKSWNEMKLIK